MCSEAPPGASPTDPDGPDGCPGTYCTPFFYIGAAQCPPQTSDPPLTPQTFSGRGAKPQWLTQSQPHAVAAPRAASEACADSRWVRDPRHWCHRSGCRPRGFMRRAPHTLWADGRGRQRCTREARSSCSTWSRCEFAWHGFQWRCELLRVGYQLHACLQRPLQSPPPPARAAHPFPSCLGERSNADR